MSSARADISSPFPADSDESQLWDMLVLRDIAAFVAGDWQQVADDFVSSAFFAIDAGGSSSPEAWSLRLATLDDYRAEWLRQAASAASRAYAEDLELALHRCSALARVDVSGEQAIALKVFDGSIALRDGGRERLDWQTLYRCVRERGRWKIAGFTGYLPR